MRRLSGVSLGRHIAAVLAGAWRPQPPPLKMPQEILEELTPRLVEKGEASLVWRRLRGRASAGQEQLIELLQAYRLCRLQAALTAHHIEEVVGRFRGLGVEPLLFKGWAVARLYPEPGLRPYCDIDCLVPPERFAVARGALSHAPERADLDHQDVEAHSQALAIGAEETDYLVDLHFRLPDLTDRSITELFKRSQRVPLGGTTVRILGPEDQLRLSALHFLRHSGWRPLWLCDLAVMVENATADFDWDYCLRGSTCEREWLVGTLLLAERLLAAHLDRLPARCRSGGLPAWLERTVLKYWGQAYWGSFSRPMLTYVGAPTGLLQALAYRWADPISVTLRWRLPLNQMPRLPWQIGDYVCRAAGSLTRWAGSIHRRLVSP